MPFLCKIMNILQECGTCIHKNRAEQNKSFFVKDIAKNGSHCWYNIFLGKNNIGTMLRYFRFFKLSRTSLNLLTCSETETLTLTLLVFNFS